MHVNLLVFCGCRRHSRERILLGLNNIESYWKHNFGDSLPSFMNYFISCPCKLNALIWILSEVSKLFTDRLNNIDEWIVNLVSSSSTPSPSSTAVSLYAWQVHIAPLGPRWQEKECRFINFQTQQSTMAFCGIGRRSDSSRKTLQHSSHADSPETSNMNAHFHSKSHQMCASVQNDTIKTKIQLFSFTFLIAFLFLLSRFGCLFSPFIL